MILRHYFITLTVLIMLTFYKPTNSPGSLNKMDVKKVI